MDSYPVLLVIRLDGYLLGLISLYRDGQLNGTAKTPVASLHPIKGLPLFLFFCLPLPFYSQLVTAHRDVHVFRLHPREFCLDHHGIISFYYIHRWPHKSAPAEEILKKPIHFPLKGSKSRYLRPFHDVRHNLIPPFLETLLFRLAPYLIGTWLMRRRNG